MIEVLDPYTAVIRLQIPEDQTVLLQAYVELFEGIGIVRTDDSDRSKVTVLTTPDCAPSCMTMLTAVRGKRGYGCIDWQLATA